MAKNKPAKVSPIRGGPKLVAGSVVLLNDNNGCYVYDPNGVVVEYYIDPPDPGPFCYYFTSVYTSDSDTDEIRHKNTRETAASRQDDKKYRSFAVKLETGKQKQAGQAAAAGRANNCTEYLLVVTRVCYFYPPQVIGSVPFRICDTCP